MGRGAQAGKSCLEINLPGHAVTSGLSAFWGWRGAASGRGARAASCLRAGRSMSAPGSRPGARCTTSRGRQCLGGFRAGAVRRLCPLGRAVGIGIRTSTKNIRFSCPAAKKPPTSEDQILRVLEWDQNDRLNYRKTRKIFARESASFLVNVFPNQPCEA